MRAAIMYEPGFMELGTWETPVPDDGEVLIAVGAAGLCAGDMYFYLGRNPYARYPQICGHEIAGTVISVGAGISGVEVGAKVAVEPFISCGRCYPCRIGKTNCCANMQIIGVHQPGGFAQYLVAPATNVHRLPEDLSLMKASFAEPVAIAIHALRRAQVGVEDILIIGCGPLGLALIEVARIYGARVYATDHHEKRRKHAELLGAQILPSDGALTTSVLDRFNGEGVPVIIEASGNVRAIEMTPELVSAGGRIVIASLLSHDVTVTLPGLDLTRKEMTLLGSRASTGCFPEALRLLASERIRYPDTASVFNLESAPEIFRMLAQDKSRIHKAVFVP